MKNIKFLKEGKKLCICLDNTLFCKGFDKLKTILNVLDLFSSKVVSCEGYLYIEIEKSAAILNEIESIDIPLEMTCIKNLAKQAVYKIHFNYTKISCVSSFVLKHDLLFEAKGFDTENNMILEFVINDHDGTYISFNTCFFNIEEYKILVKNMLAKI